MLLLQRPYPRRVAGLESVAPQPVPRRPAAQGRMEISIILAVVLARSGKLQQLVERLVVAQRLARGEMARLRARLLAMRQARPQVVRG